MSVDEEASRAQSGPDVLRILLNDDRLRFLELRTVGEGIGAVFVEAEMALHAIALVGRRGWICTLHETGSRSSRGRRPPSWSPLT